MHGSITDRMLMVRTNPLCIAYVALRTVPRCVALRCGLRCSTLRRDAFRYIYMIGWSDVTVTVICDLYAVGQHGVLCEVKWWGISRYSDKIESFFKENVRTITVLLRKWCHSKKHFVEPAAPYHGGKTTSTDVVWRNYVAVTIHVVVADNRA